MFLMSGDLTGFCLYIISENVLLGYFWTIWSEKKIKCDVNFKKSPKTRNATIFGIFLNVGLIGSSFFLFSTFLNSTLYWISRVETEDIQGVC